MPKTKFPKYTCIIHHYLLCEVWLLDPPRLAEMMLGFADLDVVGGGGGIVGRGAKEGRGARPPASTTGLMGGLG